MFTCCYYRAYTAIEKANNVTVRLYAVYVQPLLITESGSSCAGDELVPATDWSLVPLASVSQTSQDQLVVTLPQVPVSCSLLTTSPSPPAV